MAVSDGDFVTAVPRAGGGGFANFPKKIPFDLTSLLARTIEKVLVVLAMVN